MESVRVGSVGERTERFLSLLIVGGIFLCLPSLYAQESSAPAASPEDTEVMEAWLQPYPTPADPELEEQIVELQQALGAISKELVRRKHAVQDTQDSAVKAQLYAEIEMLRKEQRALDALLRDLIDEAKASEWTAIDEALARARWLERQQEYRDRAQELSRERKED